jgi:hypothetical protein
MLKHLSIVEDIFQITGRGLVVVPGVPGEGNWRVKIGDAVVLKRPDGTEIATIIRGIEMVRAKREMFPLLLGLELNKTDVPIGTEIWIDLPENRNSPATLPNG